jgi:hypothetical protein
MGGLGGAAPACWVHFFGRCVPEVSELGRRASTGRLHPPLLTTVVRLKNLTTTGPASSKSPGTCPEGAAWAGKSCMGVGVIAVNRLSLFGATSATSAPSVLLAGPTMLALRHRSRFAATRMLGDRALPVVASGSYGRFDLDSVRRAAKEDTSSGDSRLDTSSMPRLEKLELLRPRSWVAWMRMERLMMERRKPQHTHCQCRRLRTAIID